MPPDADAEHQTSNPSVVPDMDDSIPQTDREDLRSWMTEAPRPGESIFRNFMPNSMQQEELMRDLNRGLRHDLLNQMHGKDGEAKRLNQPRPGSVRSFTLRADDGTSLLAIAPLKNPS